VLVLGRDSRSFLTVIRSLGRKGIDVHIGWHRPDSPGKYSRYVVKKHVIPEFSTTDDRWKRSLINIMEKEQFDLVIPCDDPSIIPLQTHRAAFENTGRIYLLDDAVYEIANSKLKTVKLADSLGIAVPEQLEVQDEHQLMDAIVAFGFPMVLKSDSSFALDDLRTRHEVCIALNRDEANGYFARMQGKRPVLVQKHFSGFGCGVELIADKGHILSAFQHERVHEPLWGGGGSYRRSVALSMDMYGAAEKLVSALGYTGVAMLEFKKNEKTGKWVFLEINARFWGSLPLAVACGMDFPWYLYELLVNGRKIYKRNYIKGLYCRNLVADLEWMRSNRWADRFNPYLHKKPIKDILVELTNMLTLNEKSDTFQADDLMPGVADLFFYAREKFFGLTSRVRATLLHRN
jgi:predicted ATP-grasp superfamily ATP-dependent carboligase